jgi:hypothetical protein
MRPTWSDAWRDRSVTPPAARAVTVPGYALLRVERVEFMQLTLAGVALVPLWTYLLLGAAQLLGADVPGRVALTPLHVALGLPLVLLLAPALHEGAHGLAARLVGARPRFGLGPGYAYTTFDRPLGRVAFVTVALAPLVGLSLLALLGVALVPGAAGWLVFAALVNASGAIGDLWMVWRAARAPRRARFVDLVDGFAVLMPRAG